MEDGASTQPMQFLHGEITGAILAAVFEVAQELGHGFLESVYEKALALAIREKGLRVAVQYPVAVRFRGEDVGQFFADLLVEDCVVVELKATKSLLPEHQAQVINYLRATGLEVGLLVNFGNAKVEYRRLVRRK